MMTLDQTQPPSNDQPDKLQSLAIQVQNQRVDSPQRYRALTVLLQELWKQPTIGLLRSILKSQNSTLPNGLFEDLFNDAIQETVIAISRNIHKYDSERPLLPLICTIAKNKFSSLRRKYSKYGVTRVPKSKDKNCTNSVLGQVISLDALNDYIGDKLMGELLLNGVDESVSSCDLLKELLTDDPDNILKSYHVRNKLNITFQYIAICLYIDEFNMQQLASELEIPYQTLNAFFKRTLKKLEQYFRDHLQ